ncbi:methylmalonyl-CoA epimerase [Thermorudis peleae]|uniref:methylmalonyl-CoA epimerase n=1 Tax=Thermorudis peleae TaxID=1382356 RepID=UPI00068EF4F2|nr:methylmalonyl-CoA epimerase [Thermorudis peleae]
MSLLQTLALQNIHHVGIVVASLEPAIERYQALGCPLLEVTNVHDQRVRVALLASGAQYIELLTPLDDDSGVARFLAKRGDGLHHVAYQVRDLASVLQHLAAQGFELIDAEPRQGLHGWRVAFVHPRSCAGVLTELVEVVQQPRHVTRAHRLA